MQMMISINVILVINFEFNYGYFYFFCFFFLCTCVLTTISSQPWPIGNAYTRNGFASENIVAFERRFKSRTTISTTRRRRRCMVSKG